MDNIISFPRSPATPAANLACGSRPVRHLSRKEDDAALVRFAGAIADHTRLAILRQLLVRAECVTASQLSDIGLSHSIITSQLGFLRNAGIVRESLYNGRVGYCVDPEVIRKLKSLVTLL